MSDNEQHEADAPAGKCAIKPPASQRCTQCAIAVIASFAQARPLGWGHIFQMTRSACCQAI